MSIIDYFVGIELSHGLAARKKEEVFALALFDHDKQGWIDWMRSHPEIDFDAVDYPEDPLLLVNLWAAFGHSIYYNR